MNDRGYPDLWRHLLCDARRNWTGFHMPGHGYGRGFPRSFRLRLARMDLTEVKGMDDLNHPQGILLQAQERLTELAGAAQSFFLVNGSSIGIQAMMGALCRRGDTLIVPRASHRAVYHGLALWGIVPAYLYTEQRSGRPALPTPEDAEALLRSYPQAKGMVLTSPDYWGRCADVAGIAEVLHRQGKALLLDQAHGAHFGFHPALPLHGGMEGADAWVQSAHKTLPAPTQSAWLHVNKQSLLPGERVAQKLRLLSTTSPSYPMMGGLDYARHWLRCEARDAYEGLLGRLERAVRRIEETTPVRRADFSGDHGVVRNDPTRLVLDVSGLGVDAAQAEAFLLKRGVRVEWAEGKYLVLICTPWHTDRDFMRLARALGRCPRQDQAERAAELPPLPEAEVLLPLEEAWENPTERIDYRQAAGRAAGSFVIPYPPGIPILCPGECVTQAHIDWIRRCLEREMAPAGVDDGRIAVIQ